MAPQGGLGWPQDSATAPHEELCEAALGSCPGLISLDSNKIAPHFYLLLSFWEGGWYILDRGEKKQAQTRMREEKGKDNMRQRPELLPPHFQPTPPSAPVSFLFSNGGGGNK